MSTFEKPIIENNRNKWKAELLSTISVLAIILAVTYPQYQKVRVASERAAILANADAVREIGEWLLVYTADYGHPPRTLLEASTAASVAKHISKNNGFSGYAYSVQGNDFTLRLNVGFDPRLIAESFSKFDGTKCDSKCTHIGFSGNHGVFGTE